MVFGLLVFLALNALAWLGAVALATRARLAGRAELALVTSLLWSGIVTLPILGLGWSSMLYRGALAAAVMVVSLVSIGISLRAGPGSPREHLAAVLGNARALLRLPLDALIGACRAGSVAALGLVAVIGAIAYTSWLAWLTPSVGWDGIWYHEPLAYYAIQNHGFSWVSVPLTLEYVNGFPRVCEMMNLWFVIFTDRRMVDLVHDAMAPQLVVSVYVMCRRVGADRWTALAWGCAFFFIPSMVLELKTTYMDLHVAALLLGALALATRPALRLTDAAIASLALGLLGGAKGHALIYVPVLGALALGRLLWQHRTRLAPAVATSLAGIALVLAIAAPTYVRNWRRHHNPLWPIELESKSLGIHWKGGGVHGIHDVTDMNKPLPALWEEISQVPKPGLDFPDTRVNGYGVGWSFIALPLGIVSTAAALVFALRRRLERRPDAPTESLLMTLGVIGVMARFSPALQAARYNAHLTAGLMLAVAWLSHVGWRRLSEAAAGALLAVCGMLMWWADPGWGVKASDALRLASMGPLDRAAFMAVYWSPAPEVARARERELGKGDVIAFTEDKFVTFLWNERIDNRVVWLQHEGGPSLLRRLDAVGAKWVVVNPGDEQWALDRDKGWQRVGLIASNEPNWIAYRRVAHAP
jgi:hypothetical protein